MTTDLSQAVGNVASAAATPEYIADVMGRVDAALERAKAIKAALKEAMVEHILATGRDLVIGEVRYYAAQEKETKCVRQLEAVEAVFKAVGGDCEGFKACLSSNAFLPGQCRKVLPPDVFADLFVTTVKTKLKDGVPQKQLCSVNPKFIHSTAGEPAESQP